MGRALRDRLTVRLAVGLGLAAGGILVAAAAWNLRLQRAHLTRLLIASATERAEDIRRSTREAMMRNRPGEVRRIVEAIAGQPSMERIRVFDKLGMIRTSSDASEVGSFVDTVAEQCVTCHAGDEPLARLEQQDRARIFTTEQGERVLGVITPIRNEPACVDAACHAHSSSQSILGVLDFQLSLESVDRSLAASERQMLLGLLGTGVGALLAAWLLTWRMVLRPVGRLTAATSRVAAGELSTSIPVESRDEIGEMTAAWNAMIAKLEEAQSELESWGRKLEREVEAKTAELEEAHHRVLMVEKMASLGKLAAVVAHEINNPLAGIGTYARLLRRRSAQSSAGGAAEGPASGQETERILELIEEEAVRCGSIVRDLLLFSRAPEASFSSQELQPLLDRCILLLQPQAEQREVHLKLEAGPGLPAIECDASQIQQAILALVLNAIEATPEGGTVTLSAVLDPDSQGALLHVRDTGSGIPDDDIDRVFEPFFTTKAEGRGVGLGLAVVYGIVSRHHGTVELKSSPGQWTTVTLRLPRRQTEVAGTKKEPREEASG